MSRSVWKGPYINSELFEEFLKKPSKKVFKTQSRSSVILPCFIGKTLKVYNGKKYISFKVTEDMVGFKLGEFVLTRLRHIYKKK